jgi:hypothetical protein
MRTGGIARMARGGLIMPGLEMCHADSHAIIERKHAVPLDPADALNATAVLDRCRFVRRKDERRILAETCQLNPPSQESELALLSRDVRAIKLSSA